MSAFLLSYFPTFFHFYLESSIILCIFADGSGRNPDYSKAFAIISRSAKSLGNFLEIKRTER